MSIGLGKRRGLAQCSTKDSVFAILALDHRNNLRRALNPDHSESVSNSEMIEFKLDVTRAVIPYTSGVLLDPEVGAPHAISADSLPGDTGLIVALEATGYTGDSTARLSQILDDWSVGKIKRMGASAVKLLVYYHPEAAEADHQEELVQEIGHRCNELDIAFFLEPLSFSLDPNRKLTSDERRVVVLETARRLTPLGVDVLKAEFPILIHEEVNEEIWIQACQELSQNSTTPWVLLSAGVKFDDFQRQAIVAMEAGASGVLAGRAIWGEAVDYQGSKRIEFLQTTAAERMAILRAACTAHAKPWIEHFPPEQVSSNWYESYKDIN